MDMTTEAPTKEVWYRVGNAHEIDSPALLVYPERVKHNINLAKSMVGDASRLRPHVKTHKSSAITKLQLAAGITRYKCATLAEAEMLGRCGAPDVLVAYPLFGPRVQAFLALAGQYPTSRFSTLVDDRSAAGQLSEAAVSRGVVADVYIDLDIGMGRTGAPIDASAEGLYAYCRSLVGLRVLGLHAYDGQVREPEAAELWRQCRENYRPLAALVDRLVAQGFPKPEVIVGGSPSFPFYAGIEGVQCSPGTFILWDHGYATDCPNQGFLPAAVLMTRIISMPTPETICVDLGHKAVGAENPIDKRVHFPDAPSLKALRQSEEHLVLQAPRGHGYKLGDVLYGIPYHICPTVNLYDAYNVVENGTATGSWDIDARQRFRFPVGIDQ
ncbi:D-TA family PLP-dependent enzyme [Parapedobacter soli]|uniref:D-TA family PLP-dependent enzyme n=1 Tax=Parapedobacter soli TaxID=416955 RepID=UPI0021C987A8|nr:D-TA family PLP-dependent enzyme [Parapedobacter soli]